MHEFDLAVQIHRLIQRASSVKRFDIVDRMLKVLVDREDVPIVACLATLRGSFLVSDKLTNWDLARDRVFLLHPEKVISGTFRGLSKDEKGENFNAFKQFLKNV